jgi:hypothetical protein
MECIYPPFNDIRTCFLRVSYLLVLDGNRNSNGKCQGASFNYQSFRGAYVS